MSLANDTNNTHNNNPFVNLPPRLPSPSKGRIHARSPSRSPTRPQARDFTDPLLRDLSPTTTLRAFVADPRGTNSLSAPSNQADVIAKSISTASASQRALGAQAAQTCLRLRDWTRELESWEWPGTFAAPEPARKKRRMSTLTFDSTLSNDTIAATGAGDEEGELWGSLPAATVRAYERRADEIGQALDRIDLEELKEYVLASHYRVDNRPSSRDDSIASFDSPTELKHLDDFTALVTATILQALPFFSRLNRLLDTWSTRLLVLRQAPDFLLDLKRARTDLDHGWAAIAVSSTPSLARQRALFNRQVMLEMKSVIENQVTGLGSRLDRFLDRLEGRGDTVPENWIDKFELLASAYGNWVVQAERKVLQIEWQNSSGQASDIPDGSVGHLSRASTDSQGQHMPAEPTMDLASAQAIADQSARPQLPLGGLTSHPMSVLPADGYRRGRAQEQGAAEGVGQLAERRAAFLNDIERTNSLKPTKTPVRSFEHASNAFTRLFRKDRSPERSRPRRTASGKPIAQSSTNDGSERHRLPSISTTDLKTNLDNAPSAISPFVNPPKLLARSLSTPNGLQHMQEPTLDSQLQPRRKPFINEQAHLQEPSSQDTIPRLTTHKSTELSNYSVSQPALTEGWPLISPIDVSAPDRGPVRRSGSVPTMQASTFASDSEIHTPDVPLQTDEFDRMFVQSLPDNVERPRTAKGPQRSSTSAWAVDHRRAASLPRSAHRLRPESSDTISYLDMMSQRKSRGRSTSPHKSYERRQDTVPPPRMPLRSRTSADVTGAKDVTNVKKSAMSDKGIMSSPSPPALLGLSTHSLECVSSQRMAVEDKPDRDDSQDSPRVREASSAPLNAVVRKRRGKLVLQDEHENETPLESVPNFPTKSISPPEPSEDSFDRHVSEVLERLPAQIKFKARPGAVTPASHAPDARGVYGPRSKNMRGLSNHGAMTIAPAEASPKKPSFGTEPEVKLYHLTEAGREDPIKLFVRLVGEGERVMVRVGGGWADLADYLRQYAEHHGSRTVSEGGLEVQTMSSTPLARKVSGPADTSRAKTPTTPLPSGQATSRPTSHDSDHDWPSYSQPTFSFANGRSTPVHESGRQTPTLTQNPTPKSGNSRPSTANVSRPSSRQSTGEAVGLAGASGVKKAGLPDHKAKWVEGMIERAKKASAEKSKEEREKHFDEVGKAGHTRRVIFKPG